jgi:hypothetical protein
VIPLRYIYNQVFVYQSDAARELAFQRSKALNTVKINIFFLLS